MKKYLVALGVIILLAISGCGTTQTTQTTSQPQTQQQGQNQTQPPQNQSQPQNSNNQSQNTQQANSQTNTQQGPASVDFTFVDANTDKIGVMLNKSINDKWVFGPDGVADGHFKVKIIINEPIEFKEAYVQYTNFGSSRKFPWDFDGTNWNPVDGWPDFAYQNDKLAFFKRLSPGQYTFDLYVSKNYINELKDKDIFSKGNKFTLVIKAVTQDGQMVEGSATATT
ncbi:hypothetical protein JCM15765_24530 [Paradesulfitobacterium aromaticivorans]